MVVTKAIEVGHLGRVDRDHCVGPIAGRWPVPRARLVPDMRVVGWRVIVPPTAITVPITAIAIIRMIAVTAGIPRAVVVLEKAEAPARVGVAVVGVVIGWVAVLVKNIGNDDRGCEANDAGGYEVPGAGTGNDLRDTRRARHGHILHRR